MRWTAVILMVPCAAMADYVMDTRANDPGHMTAVQPEDVQCDTLVTFDNLGRDVREDQGLAWDVKLGGITTQCLVYPSEIARNPCRPNSSNCPESGGRPNGRAAGTPTLPYTLGRSDQNDYVQNYVVQGGNRWSQTDNQGPGLGEHPGGCGDWGDAPWAMHHNAPVQAACITVRFSNCSRQRRQHFLFYGVDDGGAEAELVGHFDWTGEGTSQVCRDYPGAGEFRTFCWESAVPFQAVQTWVENGAGTQFDEVCLEHAQ